MCFNKNKIFKYHIKFCVEFNKNFRDQPLIGYEMTSLFDHLNYCFLDVRKKPIESQLKIVNKVSSKLKNKFNWKICKTIFLRNSRVYIFYF